jgi:putative Mg2+ transporter-C (MgtC) family protein
MQDLLTTFAGADWWQMWVRLLLASILASAIGWDREARGRTAGLRTHILVALGAAGFVMIGEDLIGSGERGVVDPSRVLAGIIGGIGFLGAGAIIQSGGSVRGLTTAAGLWLTAAIGAAAGLGQTPLALGLAIIGVIVIAGLRRPVKNMNDGSGPKPPDDDGSEARDG